jgi:hypothetical protein
MAKRKAVRSKARGGRKAGRKKTARSRPAGRGPKRRTPKTAKVTGKRGINPVFKGLTIAAEPPIDADPTHLAPLFRAKLNASLQDLADQNKPFKFVEGYRTTDRQQWLYGSGRPKVVPHGRPGPILTNADGVTKRSKHQGEGTPGSGWAADCYPVKDGSVYIPPSSHPIWSAYATAVTDQGLVAGHHWSTQKDSPHCELA